MEIVSLSFLTSFRMLFLSMTKRSWDGWGCSNTSLPHYVVETWCASWPQVKPSIFRENSVENFAPLRALLSWWQPSFLQHFWYKTFLFGADVIHGVTPLASSKSDPIMLSTAGIRGMAIPLWLVRFIAIFKTNSANCATALYRHFSYAPIFIIILCYLSPSRYTFAHYYSSYPDPRSMIKNTGYTLYRLYVCEIGGRWNTRIFLSTTVVVTLFQFFGLGHVRWSGDLTWGDLVSKFSQKVR